VSQDEVGSVRSREEGPASSTQAAPGELRIALTISGAISLGAYEGGALAALLVAVQELCREPAPPIRIDAIAGASAGSITALLAGRALLEGYDPVHVMMESWVRQDSLAALQTDDEHAPLSVEAIRKNAVQLLNPPDEYRGHGAQTGPIRIHMALACLRGLSYQIGRLEGKPIEASTYLDWGTFTLDPGMAVEKLLQPDGASVLDFALASGANALGFPPRKLNRRVRPEDLAMLRSGRIGNLSSSDWSGWLWYTDGGTIDNEPLGRAFDVSNELDLDGTGQRLHLLIHPHPAAPLHDASWTQPEIHPKWVSTLARADKIQRTQSIYEDLRRAEKTNSRIRWKTLLEEQLLALAGDRPGLWADALKEVLSEIKGEKARIDRKEADAISGRSLAIKGDPDVEELLRDVLNLVTGLSGKQRVRVDVVSPLILPGGPDVRVEELLAGEFLAHFGGFLNERLRLNDFALGYRSMQEWLRGLEELNVAPRLAERARAAADGRYESSWDTHTGSARFRSLPLSDRWRFVRVAAHTLWVAIKELANRG
jgi:predicted acylesterase/phospholipase RssA